ncbi:DsbA family protein [Halobellus rufus]|uniref:DsbA family protein n=1 Tax=Halobellus rufus TaxID=1448860 RepID=UPI0006788278|nr:thioredoxin domain-containing protein [Halobellus rufus]
MGDREVDRRRVLSLTGAAAIASVSGCASIAQEANSDPNRQTGSGTERSTERTANASSDRTSDDASTEVHPQTIDEPDFEFPSDPIPDGSTNPRYPTIGTAEETLTLYGNWKCPYTQEFVRGQLGVLIDDFVTTGDVSIELRNVAYLDGEPYLGSDAPRASEAGLAVWNVDPGSFWTYLSYVFANQPQERYEWASTDTLVRFAEQAGVERVDRIRQAIRDRTYTGDVQTSADRAEEIGISTVPRVVYDGDVTAPTVDPEATRAQFERAANGESETGDGSFDSDTSDDSSDGSPSDSDDRDTDDEDDGDDADGSDSDGSGSDGVDSDGSDSDESSTFSISVT